MSIKNHRNKTTKIVEHTEWLDIYATRVNEDLTYIDIVYRGTDVGVRSYTASDTTYEDTLGYASAWANGYTYARNEFRDWYQKENDPELK